MTHNLKLYPTYKPSGVEWLGEIPSGWDVAKVKYSSYLKARIGWQNLRTDEFVESGPYCITGTDFKNGRIDWANCYHVSQSRYELDPKIQLDSNDILITKDGTIGKVAHVEELPDCATLNSGIFVVRPLKESYSTRFMYWVLSSNVFGSFIDYIRNGSTIHHLYQYSFERFQFPVPSKGEQHRIATFLDQKTAEIDEAVNKKQRLIDLLKEQKAILINQAVTKGLNPNVPMRDSGVEWIGDVPAHWEVRRIKQVSHILRGKFTHRPRNDPTLYDGPYPFIQTGEVARAEKTITSCRQTLNERGFAVSKMFPAETLVMTIAANIGDVAVLNFPACFPDSIVGFVPRSEVERDYLYYAFLAMKPDLLREAPVNTQGNLNIDRVGSRETPLPPIAEQRAVVQKIEERTLSMNIATTRTRRQIELLQEYRTILIANVVTGKLDVREDIPRES